MKAWLVALVVAQALDISSTCAALKTGRFYEANPLLPSSCKGIAATRAGITLGSVLISTKMKRRHPKWALAIAVTGTATGGFGFTWNVVKLTR